MTKVTATEFASQMDEAIAGSIDTRSSGLAQIKEQAAADAATLSVQLAGMRQRLISASDRKRLRMFTSGEAARLIGVSDGYLRQLSLSGDGPQPSHISQTGRRAYTLDDINALRVYLSGHSGAKARQYLPHRDAEAGEALQVLAVTNFRSGSGNTTTATHLAQYMALQGYRVLAIDLDPQASMSALLGYQPELELKSNASIYSALRYDAGRLPLNAVTQKTYFPGLDLSPSSLELQEFEHATPRNMLLSAGDRIAKDGEPFFSRLRGAIMDVAEHYDVVILDCPPQLGFLTLSALYAATTTIVTVQPQMLEVASMSQFLSMLSELLAVVEEVGGELNASFLHYLITQYEPNDGLQTQISAFLRAQLGDRVLTAPMVRSDAIFGAGLTGQTLYEAGKENISRSTYDRALDALTAVNSEIEGLVKANWGRADRQIGEISVAKSAGTPHKPVYWRGQSDEMHNVSSTSAA